MQKFLHASEWILVTSLLLIIGFLSAISYFHAHRQASFLKNYSFATEKMVAITVLGAVLKPGVYEVPIGTSIGVVLKKSCPKKFADLRSIDVAQPVEEAGELNILELEQIIVRIEGDIHPITLTVPVGTRVCEIKSKIEFSKPMDKSVFKSRRILRDGEVIVVSEKRD